MRDLRATAGCTHDGMVLSLCMIVKDEVEVLDDCLDSVAGVVDEIVVADTGSTDGTLEILRRRGVRLVQIAWCDNFAAARNAALDAATQPWVLCLDADERLRPTGHRALRAALTDERLLAVQLPVCNELGGGRTGTSYALRVFRRHPSIRYRGRIHEGISDALATELRRRPEWQIGVLDEVVIDHLGYEPTMFAARGKRERNLRLLRLELEDRPDDPYVEYKLFQAVGDGPHAEAHLFRAADLLLAGDAVALATLPIATEVLVNAALRWTELGEGEPAERAARSALAVDAAHPAIRAALGFALCAQGSWGAAECELTRALATAMPPRGFYVDEDALRLRTRLSLAQIALATGRAAEAVAELRALCADHSASAALRHLLIRALAAAGNPAAALQEAVAWLGAHADDRTCLLLAADAAEALGHRDDAAQWRAFANRSAS